jgi:hypothetical protein
MGPAGSSSACRSPTSADRRALRAAGSSRSESAARSRTPRPSPRWPRVAGRSLPRIGAGVPVAQRDPDQRDVSRCWSPLPPNTSTPRARGRDRHLLASITSSTRSTCPRPTPTSSVRPVAQRPGCTQDLVDVAGERRGWHAIMTRSERFREWAIQNGYKVSDRGRIPGEVQEAHNTSR